MNTSRTFPGSFKLGIASAAVLVALVSGLVLAPPAAGADPATSCDNDPCTNLPYSFTVTVDGMVVPHMDSDLFGTYYAGAGSPTIPTDPETYVSNPDGSVTGTVTGDPVIGLSVSEPLPNDVTVYFQAGLRQDGYGCGPGPCPIAVYPCVLAAGLTSTTCSFPDWWQAYNSTLAPGSQAFYKLDYADPGQANLVTDDGHPYAYGEGFAWLTAFIPTAPGESPSAQRVQPLLRSFTVRYRPIFGGNFTLNVKRGTSVISHRFLGWQKPGAHSTTFYCGRRSGQLSLVVVGVRAGKTQRSNSKPVSC